MISHKMVSLKAHRHEFHIGTCEEQILGDESFSEKALALGEEVSVDSVRCW